MPYALQTTHAPAEHHHTGKDDDMSKNDKNRDYTPLMCRQQLAIARQAAGGNPRIPCIADLLNIRCHILANGGRFENARATLLHNELGRGAACLTAELAQIIEAGDAPEFWHWEGETLVVDAYDPKREQSFLAMSQGGKKGMANRWHKGEGKGARCGKTKTGNNPSDNPIDNIKKVNTPFRSISKAGPSAGAAGPGFDGAVPAAGNDAPATDEDIAAFEAGTL